MITQILAEMFSMPCRVDLTSHMESFCTSKECPHGHLGKLFKELGGSRLQIARYSHLRHSGLACRNTFQWDNAILHLHHLWPSIYIGYVRIE